jgi:predicted ATPase
MEKLIIENFAGLKSVTIETSPVTGLIGPQASGKSIIAKLLYFFREIASLLPNAVLIDLEGKQYNQKCCERFLSYFPIETIAVSEFSIKYATNGHEVHVAFSMGKAEQKQTLSLAWDKFYEEILEKYAQRKQQLFQAKADVETEELVDADDTIRYEMVAEISSVLGKWANYEQIFIPAGRAFFSQLQGTVFSQLQSGGSLDPFSVAFGSFLEKTKSMLAGSGFYKPAEGHSRFQRQNYADFRKRLFAVLNAKLLKIERQEILEFSDGRRIPIAQASSGQQEILPLLLLLARFYSRKHQRGRAVYIEEPEAHLFPSTQKAIVEFITRSFRMRDDEMTLVITTHSPYILTSINNLLQAGRVYSEASTQTLKKLERIVPVDQILKPGEVGFYALESGEARRIMDRETGLINGDAIDQVSDDIAIQFGELLAEGHEES